MLYPPFPSQIFLEDCALRNLEVKEFRDGIIPVFYAVQYCMDTPFRKYLYSHFIVLVLVIRGQW